MKWAKEKKKYDGEWKNGLMHGNAKFTYFDEKKGRFKARSSLWAEGQRIKWLHSKKPSNTINTNNCLV
jgi:MORN repeat.